MGPPLKKVRFVIELNGFKFSNEPFLCKELGVADLKSRKCYLYYFRLRRGFRFLTEKDRRTAIYCRHNVHGLLFRDHVDDKNDQHQMYSIIAELIRKCENSHQYIAFKGGRIVEDILVSLGAKHIINLETLGIPEFKTLLNHRYDRESKSIFRSPSEKCSRHMIIYKDGSKQQKHTFRCPLLNVRCLAWWMLHKFQLEK